MIKWLITGLVLLAWPVWADSQTVALGDRSYVIDLPAQPANAPVILALHGGGGSPAQFARSSGFSAGATAAGYAVIYPAGVGRTRLLTWNAGYCCGYAQKTGSDDQGFLSAVIADASARFGLNGERIYLTGMSNGAMMAETFAALHPDHIRAVAAVSGTMDAKNVFPKRAVPLLIIHGTADSHVQYQGGAGPDAKVDTNFASVDAVIAAFMAINAPLVPSKHLIDPAKDGMSVQRTDYTDDTGQVQIRLLSVQGGGHVWPGGAGRKRKDEKTKDISANDQILEFFALHR